MKKRFIEIDALRGLAVIGMVIYHFIYALDYLKISDFNLGWPGFIILKYSVRITFLILVGISLVIARQKQEQHSVSLGTTAYRKTLIHGLKILAGGLLISLISYLFVPQGLVIFGILTLIATGILLLTPFTKFKTTALILGIAIIISSNIITNIQINNLFGYIIGFRTNISPGLDYFPLIPWIGYILIGIFLGNILFHKAIPVYSLKMPTNFATVSLVFMGQKALPIYIVHVPIIVAILALVGLISPGALKP